MTSTIQIAPATLEDAMQIGVLNFGVHALHVANVDWYFRPATAAQLGTAIAERLKEADTRCFVARYGSEIAGYVLGTVKRRPQREIVFEYRSLYIDSIFVRPSLRLAGTGRALVLAMKSAAATEGLGSLDLGVWAFNTEASQFFARLGFALQTQQMSMTVAAR